MEPVEAEESVEPVEVRIVCGGTSLSALSLSVALPELVSENRKGAVAALKNGIE